MKTRASPFLNSPQAIKSALVPGAATAVLSSAGTNEPTDLLARGLLSVMPWACKYDQDQAALVVVLMGESSFDGTSFVASPRQRESM